MKDIPIIVGLATVAVVIGVFVYFSGSNTPQNAQLADQTSSRQSAVLVPFTEIVSGSQSKVTSRVNYFITSKTELAQLWKLANATGKPPVVDFTTHAVIAVFAGEAPGGGSAITVSKIEDADARNVTVTLAKPEGTCTAKKAMTTPYEIVIVPTTSLPLAHTDQVVTINCPS